jgi:hypothetical protein
MHKLVFAALVVCLIPSSSLAQAQDQQTCPFVFESAETLFVDSFQSRMMCLQQSLSSSTAQLTSEEAAPSFGAASGAQPEDVGAVEDAAAVPGF